MKFDKKIYYKPGEIYKIVNREGITQSARGAKVRLTELRENGRYCIIQFVEDIPGHWSKGQTVGCRPSDLEEFKGWIPKKEFKNVISK